MKVAVIGATGNIGSKIVIELLTRGHDVSGITRHPEQLQPNVKFTARRGDVNNETGLAELLAGHDAVVSAVKFQTMDPNILIRAVKKAAVKRLLVVGDAGSLDVAPGVQLVDTPDFPKASKDEALAGREFLNSLRGQDELDWTFLSPSALLAPGERTGKFRFGTDRLLVDEKGESTISIEDYAVAMVDELESARHSHQQFTVGY
jgi:putative NADH-flavin reductase